MTGRSLDGFGVGTRVVRGRLWRHSRLSCSV